MAAGGATGGRGAQHAHTSTQLQAGFNVAAEQRRSSHCSQLITSVAAASQLTGSHSFSAPLGDAAETPAHNTMSPPTSASIS